MMQTPDKRTMFGDVEDPLQTPEAAFSDRSRLPNRYTDPFTPREGKTLVWKNVNMALIGTGDGPDRMILDNVWGEVPAKETTAIMGPSGSGKTSLLNVLEGRTSSRRQIKVEADIRLNNFSVDPTKIEVRKHIAFVGQDDSLQITSTPREAIRFSAKLRLSRNIPDHDINKLTERVVMELGLADCADTIVGGALIKGISGGERKRTAVGVEIVVKPSLIYLDEPTSGLDSFSAVQLCHVLKKVSNAGATVLFTIHQPNSEIFNSFDHLILLNKGRVMYQGSVNDVPSYFADRGRPNPPHYNPGDWIMDVAQSVDIKELEDAGFFPSDTRTIGEPFRPGTDRDALGNTIRHRTKEYRLIYDAPPPGMLTQVSLLFSREIDNLRRDVKAFRARFGLSTFCSLLVGTIFYNVGESNLAVPSNLNSLFGAVIMVFLLCMFGTSQPALLLFPEERPVFVREYSTNHYSVVSYFMSRFTMEAIVTAMQVFNILIITYYMIDLNAGFLIIYATVYTLSMASTALAVLLSCCVEDPKLASAMLPILFVPQMLFAGFFVRPDLIPSWLRWLQYFCTLTYSVRIVLVEEFSDCGDNPFAKFNCNALLQGVHANPDDTWWYWLVLVVLFVIFRLCALAVLRAKATLFY